MLYSYKDLEFTYGSLTVTDINQLQKVDEYCDITIVKGNKKYPKGYKIDQISITTEIKFKNYDGSENKGILSQE